MPNRDGGHYFLTALAPIHADPCNGPDGNVMSPTAAVRMALATLPTAAQSEACVEAGHSSPFSRCHRTHFARLVVIDQPAFNGRTTGNSLVEAIQKTDLLVHDPVDSLARAWVLVSIDFDPDDGPNDGLHDYLAGLWDVMSEELRAVFSHCYGFTKSVHDRDGFARYIIGCQVETTMPFNDYWITPPPLPTISLTSIGIAVAVATLAAGIVVGMRTGFGWGLLAGIVGLALSVFVAYRYVIARGGKPFAAAPNSDLRTVLKSLYLQQQFASFAVANQGASAEALHAAFGRFAATNQPGDIAGPTQAPGVIRS